MCGAAFGTALQVVGAYSSYVGQGAEADARAKSAEYQAAISKNNAIIAENNAKVLEMRAQDAELLGQLEKENLSRETGKLVGEGRTNYAAGNVLVGSGSALDWEADVASGMARDRLAIDRNVENTKWGFKVAAANERSQGGQSAAQAGLLESSAAGARAIGKSAQFGTLLSAASSFADRYGWGKKTPASAPKKTSPRSYGKVEE